MIVSGGRRPQRRNSRRALVAGAALACALLPAGVHAASELARCVGGGVAETLTPIPIYLPVRDHRVRELQEIVEHVHDLSDHLGSLHDGLMAAEEARGGAENLKASDVHPFPGQDCYTEHLERVRAAVAAFDTSLPDTSEFWPTLADGWDEGATCRAYEKLQRGVDTIGSWLDEIDANMGRLNGYADDMTRLRKASQAMGTAMLRVAETLTGAGGFGGGLPAWTAATDLTGYGLFFSAQGDGMQSGIDKVDGVIDGKIAESWKTKAALETERGKLQEAATVLKVKQGATNCDRAMDEMVEEKRLDDRDRTLDDLVADKWVNDQVFGPGSDQAQNDGEAATAFFGALLQGVASGLAGRTMGGGGRVGGGGNAGCPQVRAQIQADRNWLRANSAINASATAAVRGALNQDVAWYNRNCL